MTYSGVGRAYGVHISDWVREFTRREFTRGVLSVDQTLIQIRQRATEDLGELSQKHGFKYMFIIGASSKGFPGSLKFAIFQGRKKEKAPLKGSFGQLGGKSSQKWAL
jgi:hypothetical protein